MSNQKPVNPGWLWKLAHLDPTLFKGFVMAGVALLGTIGIVVADVKVNAIVGFVTAALLLVQALWTKPSVTANAKVLAFTPDPIDRPAVVCPGEAVTTASDRVVVDAVRSAPDA